MRSGEGIWGRRREVQHAILDQNQPDIPTQITKSLGMQGYVPAKIDPLIQLGIAVEDFTRPEFWILRRGRLLAGGISTGAVAGQLGFVYLQGAPGLLSIVERVEIFNRNAALQSIAVGYQAAAPAVGGAGARAQNRDSRNGFGSGIPSQTLLNGGNNAAPTVPTVYARALIGAGQLWVSDQPWVMTDAKTFLTFVNDLTVNQTLDVQVWWRERGLLDSEIP